MEGGISSLMSAIIFYPNSPFLEQLYFSADGEMELHPLSFPLWGLRVVVQMLQLS